MRRTSTPGQKKAAEARRKRFRELAATIGKLSEEERQTLAARLPEIITVEGHLLSLHNQCLLALQCPTATLVGGFQQWRHAGRIVQKGEHGHMIWVPTTTPKNGNGDSEPQENAEESKDLRFLIGTVFDVSQTEAL